MSSTKMLLAIFELGGYPDFSTLYQQMGYQVLKVNTMRNALAILKKERPEVIVAEFIFSPKHSVIISNVDSLLALLASKYPDTKLILFVDQAENHHLETLRQRYANQVKVDSLFYPIKQDQLRNILVTVNN